MICKFCGTENPDAAIFCKHCGKHLNERIFCPVCGMENEDDALFCNQCGARLSGPDSFSSSQEIVEKAPANWRKPVEICGWVFAMLGLLSALVFTFLIGFGISTNIPTNTSMLVSHDIYYFFSEGYDEAAAAVEAAAARSDYIEYYELSEYLPVVLGTIISAGVFISVVTLSAVSTARFVHYVHGRREKDFAKTAIAAYLTFVIGSLMLLALYSLNASAKYSASYADSMTGGITSGSMGVVLNDANLCGVILGGICLLLFLVCRVATKGRELLSRENMISAIFGAAAILIGGILLGFLPRGAFSFTEDYGYMTTSGTICVSYVLASMGAQFAFRKSTLIAPADETTVAIVAQLIQLILFVLVLLYILRALDNVCTKKNKTLLTSAIPLFILAVAYLALAVVLGDMWLSYVDVRAVLNFNVDSLHYTAPIVVLVFATIGLAAAIVQTALKRNSRQEV